MTWLGPVGFGVLFALYVLVIMPRLLDRYEDEFPWRRQANQVEEPTP